MREVYTIAWPYFATYSYLVDGQVYLSWKLVLEHTGNVNNVSEKLQILGNNKPYSLRFGCK